MPYRPTERTRARLAAARERIVSAALTQLAEGGYASASVVAVARRAGVATGSVYRHFPSKGDLFAEVFRRASQREVDVLRLDDRPARAGRAAARGLGRGVRAPRAGRAGPRVRADRRAGRSRGRGRAAHVPARVRGPVRARAPRRDAGGPAPVAGRRAGRDRDRRRARRGAWSGRSSAARPAPTRSSPACRPSSSNPSEPMSTLTHDVLNQSVPFEDVNLFDADLALQEGLAREGAGWAVDRARDTGAVAGSAEAQEHGRRAERNEPRLDHARPLRPPGRPGGARPELALAAARRRRARDPRAAVARPAAGRARGARRARAAVDARQRRRHVPGVDDLLGGAGAAPLG